ncbi:MAG TPA: hypothetical protein PLR88_04355, partial [Bacteroidales bacterium]|nr:hypothetical protein [Bacteroidales bacterium]
QTVCINTAVTAVTYSTTGATGATVSGLPAGVTGLWASNTVTISGTPTASGSFPYTVTLTGGCGTITANGTITVTPDNTIALTSAAGTDNQKICNNTAITDITYSTTGATGATVEGLPAGVTGTWTGDVVTISGIPTTSGTFNYTVTLTGGCGMVTITGIIIVNPDNTITLSSAAGTDEQTICLGTSIIDITYATTGATGAIFSGLPAGMSFTTDENKITISGTPTAYGIFDYSVELTGGCGVVTTEGSIIINPDNSINLTSAPGTDNQTVCINTPITDITYISYIASGASFEGLPDGVTGSWAGGLVTISGTPTESGTFNYTITLTGGCGTVKTTGIIIVNQDNTIALSSAAGTDNQTVCNNTAVTDITYSTTGATGATVAGLPSGVTGVWAGDVVTISGIPTASGSFPYTVTLTGGCGAITSAGTINVDVASAGGTVTGGTAICTGSTSVELTLTDYIGTVTRWQSSTDGTTWTDIVNTADIYNTGVLAATTHFRAVVQNGVCTEAISAPATIT